MAQRPSILQIEQAFVSGWPAVESENDKSWRWRFAHGYTKRANCAQAMDPGDEEDAEARLDRFAQWAVARGLQPTFRVTPLCGEKVIAALNKLGWQPFEQSVVMAMPIAGTYTPKHHFALFSTNDDAWHDVQAQLNGYDDETVIALRSMLERAEVPLAGALVYDDEGCASAAALTSNSGGIGVYLNVVVRQELRGKGYGRSVMQAALNWSKTVGAGWAAIQVVADNVAAINLYRSLGFSEIYRYHYRRPAS